MPKRRPKIETEIPLFLLPQVITRQIRERGESVYRISVKRTHWHHYNVTVRTKTIPRELMPAKSAALSSPEIPEGAGSCIAGEREWP